MKSLGTPNFWKAYRSLPPEVKIAARAGYQKFLQNPAHLSLRMERLRSDPRFWSVRVTPASGARRSRFGHLRDLIALGLVPRGGVVFKDC